VKKYFYEIPEQEINPATLKAILSKYPKIRELHPVRAVTVLDRLMRKIQKKSNHKPPLYRPRELQFLKQHLSTQMEAAQNETPQDEVENSQDAYE